MGETVPGTVCAKHPLGRSGKRFLAPFPPRPLAVAILFGLAGCARAPRFETAVCPPLVAGDLSAAPRWDSGRTSASSVEPRAELVEWAAGADYSVGALGDTEARPAAAVRQAHDGGVLSALRGGQVSKFTRWGGGAAGESDGEKYSRYAARHLLPGAGPSGGAGGHAAFLEWLFDEGAAPPDMQPYVEYIMNMSLADMVQVALTSMRIPLGRNTTAELSIGLMPAGGLGLPGTETGDPPDGEDPNEPPEEEGLADIFAQIESVFVGLDVPLPGKVRSRLAVDFFYGWEAEVDPDAQETEFGTWTLNVRYRAWFW